MRNDGYYSENEMKLDSMYCEEVQYISIRDISNISFKHIINNIDYVYFDMLDNEFLNYFNSLNSKDKETLKRELKFSVPDNEVNDNRRQLIKLI